MSSCDWVFTKDSVVFDIQCCCRGMDVWICRWVSMVNGRYQLNCCNAECNEGKWQRKEKASSLTAITVCSYKSSFPEAAETFSTYRSQMFNTLHESKCTYLR